MSLPLFHKDFGGQGRPIVILHGLFGSSKNWATTAGKLTDCGHVFALDLRNHGDSPHGESHRMEDLVGDLELWLDSHLKESEDAPVLVGHSMGGLAAMAFTLQNPERVAGLLVVDIAPRPYKPHHENEFAALEMDVSSYKSRQDLDRDMARLVPEVGVRQFLQMNLAREAAGYRWKINVPVLKESAYIASFDELGPLSWTGPTLFLAGGKSPYIRPQDHELIHARFPRARIETNLEADHWLHYSAADWFLAQANNFLLAI